MVLLGLAVEQSYINMDAEIGQAIKRRRRMRRPLNLAGFGVQETGSRTRHATCGFRQLVEYIGRF
jgi:hypothetical protein